MCGRTCGPSSVMAAASCRGRCFRLDATGAGRGRRFGYSSVPLPHSAGRVGSVPVGGGLKQGGRYGTLGSYHRVTGEQSRVT